MNKEREVEIIVGFDPAVPGSGGTIISIPERYEIIESRPKIKGKTIIRLDIYEKDNPHCGGDV